MAADVDIANLALSNLGDDANIAALSENSPQASYCNRFYPLARDTVLQRAGFGFTLRRIVLAQDLISLPSSWLYGYSTPSNCLRKIAVLPQDAADDAESQPYAVESISDAGDEVIYTNVPIATLRYVQRVTDTTKFTPLVVNAIARLLSSYLAGPLIKGSTGMEIAQAQLKIFEQTAYPQAAASDANSQQADNIYRFTPSGIKARGTNTVGTPIWPGPLGSYP